MALFSDLAILYFLSVICSATHVQNEDGSVVLLSASNSRQRTAIAKKLLTPSKDGKMGGAMKKVRWWGEPLSSGGTPWGKHLGD